MTDLPDLIKEVVSVNIKPTNHLMAALGRVISFANHTHANRQLLEDRHPAKSLRAEQSLIVTSTGFLLASPPGAGETRGTDGVTRRNSALISSYQKPQQHVKPNAEQQRLEAARNPNTPWKKWGARPPRQ